MAIFTTAKQGPTDSDVEYTKTFKSKKAMVAGAPSDSPMSGAVRTPASLKKKGRMLKRGG